jgi:hypothetical protein
MKSSAAGGRSASRSDRGCAGASTTACRIVELRAIGADARAGSACARGGACAGDGPLEAGDGFGVAALTRPAAGLGSGSAPGGAEGGAATAAAGIS